MAKGRGETAEKIARMLYAQGVIGFDLIAQVREIVLAVLPVRKTVKKAAQ